MDKSTETVEVPADFREHGYSGLFWTEAVWQGSGPPRIPSLVGNSGWMIQGRTVEGNVIVVRRDSAALADVFFRKETFRSVITDGGHVWGVQ